jgi:hypothetical protein
MNWKPWHGIAKAIKRMDKSFIVVLSSLLSQGPMPILLLDRKLSKMKIMLEETHQKTETHAIDIHHRTQT